MWPPLVPCLAYVVLVHRAACGDACSGAVYVVRTYPQPSLLAWTHPHPSAALNPMRRVGKQNKQAKAQQNSVLLGEERGESLNGGGETQKGPPNPYGVLGTPKSSGRHIRHKFQRGSEWNPCYKSQPLEMEELPNSEVSPKAGGNQTIEEAVICLWGPLNSRENWKSIRGHPHLPGKELGYPEAVSGQRWNIDWLVGGLLDAEG